MQPGGPELKHSKRRSLLFIGIVILVGVAAGVAIWWVAQATIMQNVQLAQPQAQTSEQASAETPVFNTEVLLSGRENVWDIAFLPTKELLFTERRGTINLLKDKQAKEIVKLGDVAARGEGGLMGVAVDPNFTENRYIYTCFNTATDIRLARLELAPDLGSVANRKDITTGMPSNASGRHSGCRMRFGTDGFLWVGTGDSAQDKLPQDPKNLGGKILRINRDGNGVTGNLAAPMDPRIYSYGHRNTQGLAFFGSPIAGVVGVSVEHGSSIDDEVNPLKPGNFGWAPDKGGYNESGVPMTDKTRFPTAVDALWSSGSPTQAPSGAVIIQNVKWKAWHGALAVAILKDKHLKILQFDNNLHVVKEEKVLTDHGRLRSVVQGPDGALYVSTDNHTNDQIIRLAPQ